MHLCQQFACEAAPLATSGENVASRSGRHMESTPDELVLACLVSGSNSLVVQKICFSSDMSL